MININTERCLITSMAQTDYSDVKTLYNSPKVRKYLGGVLNDNQFSKKYEDFLNNKEGAYFTVRLKADDSFIVLISIDPHHEKEHKEISYQISEAAMGKGYATEVVKAVMSYAFNDMQVNDLAAETQKNNVASVNLLKKLGFIRRNDVERFGEIQSIFIYKKTHL